MNLHNLEIHRRAWVWLQTRGGNGISLGVHLWELQEDTPPENGIRPGWARIDARWSNPRFRWEPLKTAMDTMFQGGWVRPLCERRSTSAHPLVTPAQEGRWGHGPCQNCVLIASERGIAPWFMVDYNSTSTLYSQLRQERQLWEMLRFPSPVPTLAEMQELLPGQ